MSHHPKEYLRNAPIRPRNKAVNGKFGTVRKSSSARVTEDHRESPV